MWWKPFIVVLLQCYIQFIDCQRNTDLFIEKHPFISGLNETERKFSEKCEQHLKKYEEELTLDGSVWAWEMLDATAKLPSSGILSGNLIQLGDFDMCLDASDSDEIFGKYCLGTLMVSIGNNKVLNPELTHILRSRRSPTDDGIVAKFGMCLPDSCSVEDFQEYYENKYFKLLFSEEFCSSKSSQPKFDGGDIATTSLLSFFLFIMLISTIYETAIYYLNKSPAHPILTAFSIVTNTKKLLKTTKDPKQINCLHGIRVISMMWIILAHRYTFFLAVPNTNTVNIKHWIFEWNSMIILGSTVAVDTFLLLSGLLVAYGVLISLSRGFKFNILLYYFHRFLRLTPLLAVLVLIHVTILKHFGSGPLWKSNIIYLSQTCQTYWWSALLYIQNYVNPEELCIPHSWYLSVDTQLFIISPIILLTLKHVPHVGFLLTGTLTLCSVVASFVVGWTHELYGFFAANSFSSTTADGHMKYHYYQTYTRAAPWLMGIILGYVIFEVKYKCKKVTINKHLSLLLWAVALAILCTCVFTGRNMLNDTYIYNRLVNSVYIALMRPGWALGVAWVIFACIIGHGGPIDWFLSLPIFQVVSKLTYSIYLIHYPLMLLMSAQTRTSSYFSDLQSMYMFWGDFAFSFGAAFIFSLAFESPIIAIEKVIFGAKAKPSPTPKHQITNETNRIEKMEV